MESKTGSNRIQLILGVVLLIVILLIVGYFFSQENGSGGPELDGPGIVVDSTGTKGSGGTDDDGPTEGEAEGPDTLIDAPKDPPPQVELTEMSVHPGRDIIEGQTLTFKVSPDNVEAYWNLDGKFQFQGSEFKKRLTEEGTYKIEAKGKNTLSETVRVVKKLEADAAQFSLQSPDGNGSYLLGENTDVHVEAKRKSSSGDKHVWVLDGQQVSGGSSLDLDFSEPGNYNLKLTVYGPLDQKRTVDKEIKVRINKDFVLKKFTAVTVRGNNVEGAGSDPDKIQAARDAKTDLLRYFDLSTRVAKKLGNGDIMEVTGVGTLNDLYMSLFVIKTTAQSQINGFKVEDIEYNESGKPVRIIYSHN